jgi:hypothetical protein
MIEEFNSDCTAGAVRSGNGRDALREVAAAGAVVPDPPCILLPPQRAKRNAASDEFL